jgi:hypothetical protein
MQEFEVTIKAIVRVEDEEALEDLIIAKLHTDKIGVESVVADYQSNDIDHFEVVEYLERK